MHAIVISAWSHDALLAFAASRGEAMRSGRRLVDGRFEIAVSGEVLEALQLVSPDPERALQVLFLMPEAGHA